MNKKQRDVAALRKELAEWKKKWRRVDNLMNTGFYAKSICVGGKEYPRSLFGEGWNAHKTFSLHMLLFGKSEDEAWKSIEKEHGNFQGYEGFRWEEIK